MGSKDTPPPRGRGFTLGHDAAGRPLAMELGALGRHGVICGVTGSGKSHTARVIIEGLATLGVAVLVLDPKGDLSGLSQPGALAPDIAPPPVILWDLDGRRGHRPGGSDRSGRRLGAAAWGLAPGQVAILAADGRADAANAYGPMVFDLIQGLAADGPGPAGPRHGPRLVVVVEEAGLLFQATPAPRRRVLRGALERLQAAGGAVVFLTSAPEDLPPSLERLVGWRVQHALWAVSRGRLARLRRGFAGAWLDGANDLRAAVMALGIGEVLASLAPDQPARWLHVAASRTRTAPLTPGERRVMVDANSRPAAPNGGAAASHRAAVASARLRSHGRRAAAARIARRQAPRDG